MKAITCIVRFDPCLEAVNWLGDRTLKQAWAECDRGDWMLWLAARVGVERKLIVLAACKCARLVLHLVPAGEDRPRIAIETAEAWCNGGATIEQVTAAARAAASAADASASNPAAAAAASASNPAAAAAAYASTTAANSAAYAASSAASAAYFANDTSACNEMRTRCANVVRSQIPFAVIDQGIIRIP